MFGDVGVLIFVAARLLLVSGRRMTNLTLRGFSFRNVGVASVLKEVLGRYAYSYRFLSRLASCVCAWAVYSHIVSYARMALNVCSPISVCMGFSCKKLLVKGFCFSCTSVGGVKRLWCRRRRGGGGGGGGGSGDRYSGALLVSLTCGVLSLLKCT